MAFDINKFKKQQSSSASRDGSNETQDVTETKTNGVIATQDWVSRVLDRVWAWTLGFRTGDLCVDHAMKTNKLFSNKLSSNRIVAREITLIGKDGKPYNLSINERGELEAHYDFERVFVYPGTDLTVKEFQYYPFYEKLSENFRGFTPSQIMTKFLPFVDEEYEMVGGKMCPRLCDANAEGFVIPRTLLVTCDQRQMITGIKICDDQFNLIRQIQLPSNKATRKLTINMPQIQEGTDWDIVKLPDVIIPSPAPFPPQPPQPGFIPVRPLDPSIFDDIPPNNSDIFSDREVSFSVPTPNPSNDIFDTEEDEKPTAPESENEEQDVKFEDYYTENYSNVILSNSDFEKNKKQFLMFEVENV